MNMREIRSQSDGSWLAESDRQEVKQKRRLTKGKKNVIMKITRNCFWQFGAFCAHERARKNASHGVPPHGVPRFFVFRKTGACVKRDSYTDKNVKMIL